MAGRNGTAALVGAPIRLGSLAPERQSIVIERDGEEVTLAGYVSGKRCPIPVTIAQEAAYQQWEDARREEGIKVTEFTAAYLLYARDSLKAVIPGLTEEEANLIAADEDLRAEILVGLKWWTRTATPDPEAAAVATTESASTTATSSPGSASPIQEPSPSTGTPT